MAAIQYTEGQVVGSLTFVRETEARNKMRRAIFRCRCSIEFEAFISLVKNEHTRSCGCFKRLMAKNLKRSHGYAGTPVYLVWWSMLRRCENPACKSFSDYGARGITVCDRWHTLGNFIEDMGEPPRGLTLDRIDNSKGYYKENCRWATAEEQNNNTRSNKIIEWRNQRLSVSQWSREIGIPRSTIHSRMHRGWSIADALSRPVR